MIQSLPRRYTLSVIKLQHLVEKVEGIPIYKLADVVPCDLFFLHLIWDQAPIAILKSDFLDSVRTEETNEWDQVGNCEILYLAAVIQRENRMSLGQEAEENDTACPNIDCTRLVRKVEEGFGWHIPLRSGSVLDLHGLLQIADFHNIWVIFQGLVPWVVITVHLDL